MCLGTKEFKNKGDEEKHSDHASKGSKICDDGARCRPLHQNEVHRYCGKKKEETFGIYMSEIDGRWSDTEENKDTYTFPE
jgi:hypothetical protein